MGADSHGAVRAGAGFVGRKGRASSTKLGWVTSAGPQANVSVTARALISLLGRAASQDVCAFLEVLPTDVRRGEACQRVRRAGQNRLGQAGHNGRWGGTIITAPRLQDGGGQSVGFVAPAGPSYAGEGAPSRAVDPGRFTSVSPIIRTAT